MAMDTLFDDKGAAVGDDLEAYCPTPRCKGDTTHVIINMYENEIRRVQCNVCNDVHAFRKPRGIPYDRPPEPLKKRVTKKPSWQEAMAKVTEAELANCRPYSTLDWYEHLDIVSHPKFDIGFVTELLVDNKVEITFKDEARILVHRRADKSDSGFADGISELPAPRQKKSRKRRKKGPSELAQRLLSERMLANTKSKSFAEVAQSKEEMAGRAAADNRRLALDLVATKAAKGVELTPAEEKAAEEAKRLAKEEAKVRAEEERERKRLEQEKEKEKKRLEREKEKEKKRLQKEKEKLKKQKEREKEKARLQKEKEKLKKQKEREKERERRDREKEFEKKQRAKEAERKKRDRVREQKEKERQRKKLAVEKLRKKQELQRKKDAAARAKKQKAGSAASARRTGGKKSVPAVRRTGGKKTIRKR